MGPRTATFSGATQSGRKFRPETSRTASLERYWRTFQASLTLSSPSGFHEHGPNLFSQRRRGIGLLQKPGETLPRKPPHCLHFVVPAAENHPNVAADSLHLAERLLATHQRHRH